jgi:hypothetical protein
MRGAALPAGDVTTVGMWDPNGSLPSVYRRQTTEMECSAALLRGAQRQLYPASGQLTLLFPLDILTTQRFSLHSEGRFEAGLLLLLSVETSTQLQRS